MLKYDTTMRRCVINLSYGSIFLVVTYMEEFFTFREFMHSDDRELTPSMEDYLEMIYRLSENSGYTRIHDIAAALNVQPPSVSKMIQKLAEHGYLNYEKYGIVIVSEKGKGTGKRLLLRHNLSEEFLKIIGVTKSVLEETEKIEHALSNHTLECISAFITFIKQKPGFLKEYKKFYKEHFTP